MSPQSSSYPADKFNTLFGNQKLVFRLNLLEATRNIKLNKRYKQHNKLRETEEGRYKLKLQSIQIFWGEHVVEWYKKQKPNCRICKKKLIMSSILKGPGVDYGEEAVIDHDYKLGTQRDIKKNGSILPRGILCHTCNQGIGLLKENKMILKNAIKYVEGLI